MEQQFVVLNKANPMAWALMPYAIERIKQFCIKHRTDVNPEELANLVQQHFLADNPLLLVIVGYQKGVGVFAHALGSIDDLTGNRFMTVMQFETDIPFQDREELKRMWDQFRLWGIANGATDGQLVTMDDAHVRMFKRYYGFKRHRITMRKSLLEKDNE